MNKIFQNEVNVVLLNCYLLRATSDREFQERILTDAYEFIFLLRLAGAWLMWYRINETWLENESHLHVDDCSNFIIVRSWQGKDTGGIQI
jgi:hypothetical protein